MFLCKIAFNEFFMCHIVHQVGDAFVHAPFQAARTETPARATECNQVMFASGIAVHLREAVREKAAGQELV